MNGFGSGFLYNWKLNLLKGVLAVIFGIAALLFPEITLITVVKIFGAFAIAGGLLVLTTAAMNKKNSFRNYWLLEGIFDIVFGVIILLYSKAAMNVLMILIGFWAIFMGIIMLMIFSSSRRFMYQRGLFLLNAIISIVFGALIIINPFEGGVALTILIGVFAILYGAISIITSIKLAKS
jgi:uncharacterized membrane protein HdeD (DUF308 family)